jgi:hypothetical protein
VKVIRFRRTDDITTMSVHYWCRCNLKNGFRVWHDTGIGTNGENKLIWRDHICIKTIFRKRFRVREALVVRKLSVPSSQLTKSGSHDYQ